jgi:co-chaperonin GroES (HSP10)
MTDKEKEAARDAAKEAAKKLANEYLGWMSRPQRPMPKESPAATLGERIIVRQMPPETMSTGKILHIPATATIRPFRGLIIGAGDQACDKLYDAGVERNDEIWYGKYTGVVEDWQHLIVEGSGECAHDWSFIPIDTPDSQARLCSSCGAIMVVEPMVLMNVNDIVADVDLQSRIEAGEVIRYRDTYNDRTWYKTVRKDATAATTWDIGNRADIATKEEK